MVFLLEMFFSRNHSHTVQIGLVENTLDVLAKESQTHFIWRSPEAGPG